MDRKDFLEQMRVEHFDALDRFKKGLECLRITPTMTEEQRHSRAWIMRKQFFENIRMWGGPALEEYKRQENKRVSDFLSKMAEYVNTRHKSLVDEERRIRGQAPLRDEDYAAMVLDNESLIAFTPEVQNLWNKHVQPVFDLTRDNITLLEDVRAAEGPNLLAGSGLETDFHIANTEVPVLNPHATAYVDEYLANYNNQIDQDLEVAAHANRFDEFFELTQLRFSIAELRQTMTFENNPRRIVELAHEFVTKKIDRFQTLSTQTVFTDEERLEMERWETKRRRIQRVFQSKQRNAAKT
jgi:hypothetical protein